ncbi:ribonuclease HI [Mobiluncus mulieris ATCC 35239]|uniref:Ribonuclease H n=1 Tax=Mobiluncus mulieris ATCC 35239 TaxID=871571 RepID=E0QS61_9ACTO|nr:ribonuclease H [Mobiluncus mulieris]EFM45637.1 ribonuclease HI [Mobiluncus mulieris ATCC 35239]MCU9976435.1 ribonuclease HI [Mobiluncus mulieris]MCU9996772.1 ribonuclease HI [Mobiluncus mulieris]MCV0003274.1 ribonuclease HI [Mobiluncus mulieris]MCV0014661.1 ribonuclease HI [Mobiluncus mulieris]
MVYMEITVAADGSALGNPGPAGWAWFVDENNWSAGGWPQATNNRGELMAVIDFLEASAVFPEIAVHFLCDSQYVINSVTKWMPGWKRRGWRKADGKPVLNDDLMKRLDALLAGRRVRFEWVKGHAGHPMNERADDLARAAATAFQAGRQPVAGPGLGVFLASRGASPDSGVNSGDVESGSTGFQPALF